MKWMSTQSRSPVRSGRRFWGGKTEVMSSCKAFLWKPRFKWTSAIHVTSRRAAVWWSICALTAGQRSDAGALKGQIIWKSCRRSRTHMNFTGGRRGWWWCSSIVRLILQNMSSIIVRHHTTVHQEHKALWVTPSERHALVPETLSSSVMMCCMICWIKHRNIQPVTRPLHYLSHNTHNHSIKKWRVQTNIWLKTC